MSKINRKFIIQEVTRQVQVSHGGVVDQSFEQVLHHAGFEAVVAEIQFDKSFVELNSVSQHQEFIEAEISEFEAQSGDVVIGVGQTLRKIVNGQWSKRRISHVQTHGSGSLWWNQSNEVLCERTLDTETGIC